MSNASAKPLSGQPETVGQQTTAEHSLPERTIVLLCLAATTATFAVDLSIPLGVAAGVPYIVPVLFSLWSRRRSTTLGVAAVGTLLTIVGFVASPSGGELWKVIANRFLAVFAIWITTALCLWQKQQKRKSAHLYVQNELLATERRKLAESLELVLRQKAELAGTNGNLKRSRSAAINMMRDAEDARRKAEEAERALRQSQEYTNNILRSMIDTLIVVAPDGTIVTVNEATCTLLGYREEELIGQPARLLFSEEAAAAAAEEEEEEEGIDKIIASRKALPVKGRMLRTLIRVGHVSDVEGWYTAKDGSRIPVTFSGSVMRDGEDELLGIVCVAQDSTQQKQLQCELAHAQKLESVGQLAAGIAHEINTPTQYVGDNTRFLKEAFGDISTVLDSFEKLLRAAKDGSVDEQLVAEVEATLKQADVEYLAEEIPQAIDQSLDGVERVAKIVRAMKEFSHPGGEEKSLVNLTEAIETTITVARNEWKYVAEVITDFDSELPAVSCLPGELNQVFLNLIVNATHAIGDALGDDVAERGTITVGTRRDGEWAEIFVRDTGTGIPEDVRARIFDPFFTTKEVGKGTGQGLAIARSVVVDKHGGTIGCETEEGKGTTFIVRLPIDEQRQTQGASGHEDANSIR